MQTMMQRLLGYALAVTLLFTTTSHAQIDRGLAGPSRWVEHAYGMSLSAPANAVWLVNISDGAKIKFQLPSGSTISVYIRKAENEFELASVKDKAIRELIFGYPSAVTMQQDSEPITVAERDALGLFMLVPDEKRSDWVFAQVYTPIDPRTIAIYQLECEAQAFETDFPAYRALLDSVVFADPKELDQQRTERIERGRVWLESINHDKAKGALIDEQWLRITQAGKDVGYMRIRQHDEADHVPPGTSVQVNSRIVDGDHTYDTEAQFFEADDRTVEFWTIATTLKIPQNIAYAPGSPPAPDTHNWRQTGLRDGDAMEVSQETPTSIKKLPWKLPPFPYISQVNSYILPALLPRDEPTELAFYSFHQDSAKLSLRTLRIEPLPGGSYRVFDRPTPDREEQVSTYSPTGRLIEQRMSDGRVYLATTPQELRRIWGKL